MNKMSKWLPFRFKRSQPETKPETQLASTQAPARSSNAPMSPWRAFPEFDRLFDSMLSDRFWSDPLAMLGQTDRFFGDFSPARFQPSIDVVDEGNGVRVSAELPGVDVADVRVSVHDGVLTIQGEKKVEDESKEEGCYRLERYFGQFQRTVPLPAEVDVDRIEAKFDKGLLTVRAPKVEGAMPETPRDIPVG